MHYVKRDSSPQIENMLLIYSQAIQDIGDLFFFFICFPSVERYGHFFFSLDHGPWCFKIQKVSGYWHFKSPKTTYTGKTKLIHVAPGDILTKWIGLCKNLNIIYNITIHSLRQMGKCDSFP